MAAIFIECRKCKRNVILRDPEIAERVGTQGKRNFTFRCTKCGHRSPGAITEIRLLANIGWVGPPFKR